MKISEERKKELEDIYQSLLKDEKIRKMKEISMHRGSNCFIHSFKVAKLAIKRALRHKIGDLYIILVGSILHDYYLYDWRNERDKMKQHLASHPYIAARNALRDFHISEKIKKVIETHMWPVNFRDFPKSKEARIIANADKAIYIKEMFCSKKHKKKKEEVYLLQISKLFAR